MQYLSVPWSHRKTSFKLESFLFILNDSINAISFWYPTNEGIAKHRCKPRSKVKYKGYLASLYQGSKVARCYEYDIRGHSYGRE